MKASLVFETEKIRMSSLGGDLAFPDLVSGLNVQNKAVFDLEENDEIFEGYGKSFVESYGEIYQKNLRCG